MLEETYIRVYDGFDGNGYKIVGGEGEDNDPGILIGLGPRVELEEVIKENLIINGENCTEEEVRQALRELISGPEEKFYADAWTPWKISECWISDGWVRLQIDKETANQEDDVWALCYLSSVDVGFSLRLVVRRYGGMADCYQVHCGCNNSVDEYAPVSYVELATEKVAWSDLVCRRNLLFSSLPYAKTQPAGSPAAALYMATITEYR